MAIFTVKVHPWDASAPMGKTSQRYGNGTSAGNDERLLCPELGLHVSNTFLFHPQQTP